VVLAALVVGLFNACGSGDDLGFTPGPSATPGLSPAPSGSPVPSGSPTASADDGVPTVAYAELPPEAHHAIDLIDRGGPYPYRQDDGTFSNRERLLPEEPDGYYREYTVETPGSPDRGARRIVAARDGTLYYTDDHYESFRRIDR
jgi:ribonuclease T1